MGEHCHVGTPNYLQGLVEKKLLLAMPQSCLTGFLVVRLIAMRQLDNLRQCLIRLHLGFQLGAKFLSKQKLCFYWETPCHISPGLGQQIGECYISLPER